MLKMFPFRILIFLLFYAPTTLCLVQPPKPSFAFWNSLPSDIKKYTFPFIASSRVSKVAETIRALNATNKFCRAAIQSEDVMMKILDRMPYTANAIYLMQRLRRFPVLKNCGNHYNALKKGLKNGLELNQAIQDNKLQDILHFMNEKNINLDLEEKPDYPSSLLIAVSTQNIENTRLLLEAGANPDVYERSALLMSAGFRNIELVTLLLAFDADPNVTEFEQERDHKMNLIRKLTHYAQEKRKQRLLALRGNISCTKEKKADGCAIS